MAEACGYSPSIARLGSAKDCGKKADHLRLDKTLHPPTACIQHRGRVRTFDGANHLLTVLTLYSFRLFLSTVMFHIGYIIGGPPVLRVGTRLSRSCPAQHSAQPRTLIRVDRVTHHASRSCASQLWSKSANGVPQFTRGTATCPNYYLGAAIVAG